MAVQGTVAQTQLVVLQRVVHVTDFCDLIKIYVTPGPDGELATQIFPAFRTLILINNFLAMIVVAFLRYHHNCKDLMCAFMMSNIYFLGRCLKEKPSKAYSGTETCRKYLVVKNT